MNLDQRAELIQFDASREIRAKRLMAESGRPLSRRAYKCAVESAARICRPSIVNRMELYAQTGIWISSVPDKNSSPTPPSAA